MRARFLGDSYDIVKRFFCEALRSQGFTVFIDPMLTGAWSGQEDSFFRFLGVERCPPREGLQGMTALLLDPDTGVSEKGSLAHVSYERLAQEADNHALVFSFDQAFSRAGESGSRLEAKLGALNARGCAALYYASHAHFLFVSREHGHLQRLRAHLVGLGLPDSRFVPKAHELARK